MSDRQVQRATYGSDGVFYAVGSIPPPEIAEEFGDHIWQAPEGAASGELLMPMVTAGSERTGPSGVQVAPVNPFDPPAPTKPAEVIQAAPAAVPEPSRASVEAPPQSGPGSGVEAWREYAAAKGVEVPEHAKRAEIVEALEAAGVPVN